MDTDAARRPAASARKLSLLLDIDYSLFIIGFYYLLFIIHYWIFIIYYFKNPILFRAA